MAPGPWHVLRRIVDVRRQPERTAERVAVTRLVTPEITARVDDRRPVQAVAEPRDERFGPPADVRRRQAGKPYLFRLDLDPNDTLVWARRIKAYEAARGERLADVLTPEDKR